MKVILKRVVAFLLAFTMVFSVAPVQAQAASTKKEKENNNTKTKANKISTKYTKTGSLSSKKDNDWFVYTVEDNGLKTITFDIKGKIKENQYFYVALYKANKLIDYKTPSSSEKSVSFKNMSYKKGTKLYVFVSGINDPEYSVFPKGIKYALSVKAEPTPDYTLDYDTEVTFSGIIESISYQPGYEYFVVKLDNPLVLRDINDNDTIKKVTEIEILPQTSLSYENVKQNVGKHVTITGTLSLGYEHCEYSSERFTLFTE